MQVYILNAGDKSQMVVFFQPMSHEGSHDVANRYNAFIKMEERGEEQRVLFIQKTGCKDEKAITYWQEETFFGLN